MTEGTLRGRTILVVEDEYLLAQDMCNELASQEAAVLGPVATAEKGLTLLNESAEISAAILDVNLRGEPVFPLADELVKRNVPIVFATGYDASIIPDRFKEIVRCEKPVNIAQVMQVVARVAQN
jgi:DNA-binding NtrC family response regulator